jgi:hypothetical protein
VVLLLLSVYLACPSYRADLSLPASNSVCKNILSGSASSKVVLQAAETCCWWQPLCCCSGTTVPKTCTWWVGGEAQGTLSLPYEACQYTIYRLCGDLIVATPLPVYLPGTPPPLTHSLMSSRRPMWSPGTLSATPCMMCSATYVMMRGSMSRP